MKRVKREIDLSTEKNRKEFFDILDSFKSKTEAYEYVGVSCNSNGVKYLKELADKVNFDLNTYSIRRSVKTIKCLTCGKEFKQAYTSQKFCSLSCSATYNNKHRNQETLNKLSESLIRYYKNNKKSINPNSEFTWVGGKKKRIKPKVCPICGKTDCNKKGICCHTKKFFVNLSYFGFDLNCLGTEKVFDEYNKVKKLLEKEYYENEMSSLDLKEKYKYPKTYENITQFLRVMGIKVRTLSESQINLLIKGKKDLPTSLNDIKMGFKHGWHDTWGGKKIFYRSGAELKYAELLDEGKVPYDVESLRIIYYDTEKGHNRVAIPDFLLTETNEIVEVKSRITFRKQNMLDKFKRYEELGYKPKLLYEGIMYNSDEIKNLEEFGFVISV